MMRLLPSASPPGTPPRSAMLKSWTTCVRCWSRRNFPAVTRWSSVGRKNSICPFPACPRRESISSLPALCSTPICIRLWSDTLVWLCGSMSGTKTSADEACAMPGTFAVFALGLEGPKWWRLVCDYLDRCDDEHSSLQEKFLHIFVQAVRVHCPVPAGAGPRSTVHAESEARKGVPRPDRQ